MVNAIVIGFITAEGWFGNHDKRRPTGKRSFSCPLPVFCEEACIWNTKCYSTARSVCISTFQQL